MPGFSLGSSAEAVRHGRLFPQKPYTTHVNTFHIPSVESTLLHSFSRGPSFVHAAPIVFQDSLRDTMRYIEYGMHIDPRELVGPTLTRLESVEWELNPTNIIWTPKCLLKIEYRPASAYQTLVALYWRINGASDIFARYKVKRKKEKRKEPGKGSDVNLTFSFVFPFFFFLFLFPFPFFRSFLVSETHSPRAM